MNTSLVVDAGLVALAACILFAVILLKITKLAIAIEGIERDARDAHSYAETAARYASGTVEANRKLDTQTKAVESNTTSVDLAVSHSIQAHQSCDKLLALVENEITPSTSTETCSHCHGSGSITVTGEPPLLALLRPVLEDGKKKGR